MRKQQKKITKLSNLEREKETNVKHYLEKYSKQKLKNDNSVKYSASERLEHHEVKRRLYKNMKFSKSYGDGSYEISEIDLKTKECKMDVVASYDKLKKEATIVANKMDNEDHYILTMVEQAREVVKQFIERGEDPGKISIQIENCARYPETAMKLEKSLQILGLKSKYDEETRLAIERYNKKITPQG